MCIKSEKLLEQRLLRATEERARNLQQSSIEARTILELKEQELQGVKHKLELAEMEKRYGESGQQKKVAELEKLNALLEQKFSLTERELSEQRAKFSEKDKDFKEAQKDGYALRMELQQLK